MLITRKEAWGTISYDTDTHLFSYEESAPMPCGPYCSAPVLVNAVVTHDCNMRCRHCVAADYGVKQKRDLAVTPELLSWLNEQPFLVVVVTGGEPLLPLHEERLLALLQGVKRKGLVVDTNGSVWPSARVLAVMRKKGVMVRVSLDSTLPKQDTYLRHERPSASKDEKRAEYELRLTHTASFVDAGITTGVQSVVYRTSHVSGEDQGLHDMPVLLEDLGVTHWHLQRLIPSNLFKQPGPDFSLSTEKYEGLASRLAAEAAQHGIHCMGKRDKRHNSVFLLLGDGELYTQGSLPGQKVHLGSIRRGMREPAQAFGYVSAADHAARYYAQD